MRIPPYFCAALVAFAVAGVSCSSTVADSAPSTTTTTTTTSTTTTSTTQLDVVTTIRRIPAKEFASEGHITIGATRYDFAFECFAAGAGDILALGIGDDPETGEPTQVVVQAFLGQPFVAVLIGESRVLELGIEDPAELFVQGDMIRGSALRFVDAAGSAGVGEAIGLGTVTVACQGFAPGLPEDYIIN